MAKIRFACLKEKMLPLDPIEECQPWADRQIILLHKWREQDYVLRWRIARAYSALAQQKGESLRERWIRTIHKPQTSIRGIIWYDRRFTARFPFVKTDVIKTTVSFISPVTKKVTQIFSIDDLPVNLVEEIMEMEELEDGLKNQYARRE
jgi:hypothetical protein